VAAGSGEEAFVVVQAPQNDQDWSPAIAGIVAARLRDKFARPVAVLTEMQDGSVKGSVRSVEGIHAVAALEGSADLLDKFGGHQGAAGVSLGGDHVEALKERLARAATSQYHATAAEALDEASVLHYKASEAAQASVEATSTAARSAIRALNAVEELGAVIPTPPHCNAL